ncbi:MAG: hypothetical protein U1D35_02570 [Paracoccaceae bacterium]|nr:hypothetical protein [Paracoccaceae bacterium]
MRAALAVLIWLCAAMVQAGAWPRSEGEAFVSLSADQNQAQIYGEYGIGGDWTLGMEATMSAARTVPDVIGFLQHPIWREAAGGILSGGLAFGTRDAARQDALYNGSGLVGVLAEQEVVLRGGLFWGRGFETRWGNGWTTIEAQAESVWDVASGLGRGAMKLDATVGIRPTERLMLMAQAQTYQRDGSAVLLRLEPSAGWSLGRSTLVLSPSVGVSGPTDPRFKLGVWLDF